MRLTDTAALPAAMTTADAADLLGVTVDLLWKLARDGTAPVAPLRLGARSLRWPTAELLRLLGLGGADEGEPASGGPVGVVTLGREDAP